MPLVNDRYELLEVIASGGMATVWRARDTRLNRLVALKRPHPAPPGDDSAERLSREARAAASLNHPNLITIYDFGTDETGPYLVMELVDGPTLQDLSGEIPPSDVSDLGARLANALAVIHAAGIVHRDVKPANVIMSNRGPLLTDFGIALDPDATAEITAPGRVVATPSYAAPEVLRGEKPTPASDVYSLGVMIEELIRNAGASPDPAVEEALSTALAPSPGDRPTAAGFAAALGGAAPTVTGIPAGGTTMVLEATPSPPPTEEPERRRNPGWALVAGVLALLALGLLALGVALSGDEPPAAATELTAPTTVIADTSTSSSTTPTSSTTTTTTTVLAVDDRVAETRDELESILLRPPRSNLNPPDVEDIMEKVDEAIAAADDGEQKEAEKKLSETARRLDEKLDGDRLSDAHEALEALADLLDVELESPDRDNDDKEDD